MGIGASRVYATRVAEQTVSESQGGAVLVLAANSLNYLLLKDRTERNVAGTICEAPPCGWLVLGIQSVDSLDAQARWAGISDGEEECA